VVTPDLKLAKQGGLLLHVDLAAGQRRLGGSALAQAYNQIGSDCPDVDPAMLKAMWNAVQAGVKQGMISAGHDISDGGIATTLLEMAFAGEEREGIPQPGWMRQCQGIGKGMPPEVLATEQGGKHVSMRGDGHRLHLGWEVVAQVCVCLPGIVSQSGSVRGACRLGWDLSPAKGCMPLVQTLVGI
jgi:hypothetical protein